VLQETNEITSATVHAIRQKLQIILGSVDDGPNKPIVIRVVHDIAGLLPRDRWHSPRIQ
jgi:hypothetical protein